RPDARGRERGKSEAEEAAQHERERNRVERARGELLEQREYHHGGSARAKDRGRNVEVSKFRQEIAQRDQGQTATARVKPWHEVRAGLNRFACERRWRCAKQRTGWPTVRACAKIAFRRV